VEVIVFQAEGRTNMTNSISASCNLFPKAPTRGQSIVRLTLIVAFLFEVSSVLPKLESGDATAGFRQLYENLVKLLRLALRKLKL
jgi:preprotein translocase subunit SecG